MPSSVSVGSRSPRSFFIFSYSSAVRPCCRSVSGEIAEVVEEFMGKFYCRISQRGLVEILRGLAIGRFDWTMAEHAMQSPCFQVFICKLLITQERHSQRLATCPCNVLCFQHELCKSLKTALARYARIEFAPY